jgi:hypothetical protein
VKLLYRADAEMLIDMIMILNRFVIAERPVVLADTYLLHWQVPYPDAGSGSSPRSATNDGEKVGFRSDCRH